MVCLHRTCEPSTTVRSPIAGRRGRISRATLSWAGFGVSALFAYLAVRHVDFQNVWQGLRASNYWWLLPAFATLVAAILLKAVRWRYLFTRETRPATRPVVAALLIGYFFNSVLPARAGEAARVLALWGVRPVHVALRPLRRLPFLAAERVEHIGDRIGEGLAAARQPRLAAAALAWTTIGWLAPALSVWFVMRGF